MAKKKEEVLKFEAIRPFGPTIVKGKMPNTLVKLMDDKASEMFNNKEYAKKFKRNFTPTIKSNVVMKRRQYV